MPYYETKDGLLIYHNKKESSFTIKNEPKDRTITYKEFRDFETKRIYQREFNKKYFAYINGISRRSDKQGFFEDNKGMLISVNKDAMVLLHRNTLANNKELPKEYFNYLKFCNKIKRPIFSKKMNDWFRDINDSWEFEGKKYKTNGNFSKDDSLNGTIETKFGDALLVYHWGRVVLFTHYYNAPHLNGRLLCPKTHKFLRWCKLTNCSKIKEI